MGTISIAVPTYRRPVELPRLLTALLPQVGEETTPESPVEVVVVDNDAEGSASATIDAWRRSHPDAARIRMRYAVEPRPGIAAVRNRLLDETAGSEVVVFVDDDQIPDEGWLATMLRARRDGLGDLIAGPVRPVYGDGVSSWITEGPFHDGPHLSTGDAMDHAEGGNLLVDRALVERLGCRFPDYGTRGAEDSYFTKAMTDRGARLRWCAEAVVREPVPAARTTPRWVLTRSLGNGLSWGAMLAEAGAGLGAPHSTPRRLGVTAQGAVRVAAGVLTAGAAVVRRSPAHLGLAGHRAARGLGIMGGAWGLVHDEYARPGTRRWRREPTHP